MERRLGLGIALVLVAVLDCSKENNINQNTTNNFSQAVVCEGPAENNSMCEAAQNAPKDALCAYGYCRQPCTSDAECEALVPGSICLPGADGSGCRIPQEAACGNGQPDCSGGLLCVLGACRAPCVNGECFLQGLTCVDGACMGTATGAPPEPQPEGGPEPQPEAGLDSSPEPQPEAGEGGKDGPGSDAVSDSEASAPISIQTARQTLNPGDSLALDKVIVIGVRKPLGSENGFYISDSTQGPAHCLFVDTATVVPTWQLFDVLNIVGMYGQVNGIERIQDGATITFVSSGAPLSELDVTVADLTGGQAEDYESCRVRVQGVVGVTMGIDTGVDQSGQQIRTREYLWTGSTFVIPSTAYAVIKGFAGFSSGTREILPQVDADIIQ